MEFLHTTATRLMAREKLMDIRAILAGTAPGTCKEGGAILKQTQSDFAELAGY